MFNSVSAVASVILLLEAEAILVDVKLNIYLVLTLNKRRWALYAGHD